MSIKLTTLSNGMEAVHFDGTIGSAMVMLKDYKDLEARLSEFKALVREYLPLLREDIREVVVTTKDGHRPDPRLVKLARQLDEELSK